MLFIGLLLLVVGVLVLILAKPAADARKATWVLIAIGAALLLVGAIVDLGTFAGSGVDD